VPKFKKKLWGKRGEQFGHRRGVIVVDKKEVVQSDASPPGRQAVHPDHRNTVRSGRTSRPPAAPSAR
jgi:hypothetical protein